MVPIGGQPIGIGAQYIGGSGTMPTSAGMNGIWGIIPPGGMLIRSDTRITSLRVAALSPSPIPRPECADRLLAPPCSPYIRF